MSDMITVTGIVATDPKQISSSQRVPMTSFRLASGQRKFDKQTNQWVDAGTNWYSVTAFRHLAHNIVDSVRKGEHVVITGRVQIRNWTNEERSGTTIDVIADSVGHDLTWCTTTAVRKMPTSRTGPDRPDDPQEPYQLDAGDMEHAEASADGFLPQDNDSFARLDS